jgi:DNA-binding response OmpR family regulator
VTSIVMVVDDENTILRLIKLVLSPLPCAVMEIDDAGDAIKLLESVIPDLFIVDLMMPRINGFELCRYIRNCISTTDTPIILLSAQYDRHTVLEGLEAGATICLPKSSLHSDLTKHVTELLNLNNVPS